MRWLSHPHHFPSLRKAASGESLQLSHSSAESRGSHATLHADSARHILVSIPDPLSAIIFRRSLSELSVQNTCKTMVSNSGAPADPTLSAKVLREGRACMQCAFNDVLLSSRIRVRRSLRLFYPDGVVDCFKFLQIWFFFLLARNLSLPRNAQRAKDRKSRRRMGCLFLTNLYAVHSRSGV